MKFTHAIAVLLLAAGPGVRAQTAACAPDERVQQVVWQALEKQAIAPAGVIALENPGCGSPISARAHLEVTRMYWDSVLRSLEVRMRCQSPRLCLPFLVRVRLRETNASPIAARTLPGLPPAPAMVKPGQLVKLYWQQGGLRISRTVVCLDRGTAGEPVRTRSQEGGKVMRARVVGPGMVEAEL